MFVLRLHDELISCVPNRAIVKPGFDLERLNWDASREAEYYQALADDEAKWRRDALVEHEYELSLKRAGDVKPTGPVSRLCWWRFVDGYRDWTRYSTYYNQGLIQ